MIEARSLPLAAATMSNAKRRCEALLGPPFYLFKGERLFVPAFFSALMNTYYLASAL